MLTFFGIVLVVICTLVACLWVIGHPPPESPRYRRDEWGKYKRIN